MAKTTSAYKAIEEGDVENLKKILKKKDPNSWTGSKRLLFLAIMLNNLDAVNTLLDAGAEISYSSWNDDPAYTISTNKIDIFKAMIDKGGLTPAHISNHAHFIESVISRGANVDSIKFLTDVGFDFEYTTNTYSSCIKSHKYDINLLEYIYKEFEKRNQQQPNIADIIDPRTENGRITDLINLGLNNQLNPEEAERCILRCNFKNLSELEPVLQDIGPYRNIPGSIIAKKLAASSSYNPSSYNIEMIDYLVSKGADICDNSVMSPIVVAATSGNYNDIEETLDHVVSLGADINALNTEGNTAFDTISRKLLTSHSLMKRNRYTPLYFSDIMLPKLLDIGADFNRQGLEGNTFLHNLSMYAGHEDVFKKLLDLNPDLHIKNKDGKKAFELAIENKDIKKVKYFIDKGMDINELASDGKPYKEYAKKFRMSSEINRIIEGPSSRTTSQKPTKTKSPWIAIGEKDLENLKQIINKGFDLTATKAGESLISHAILHKNDAAVNFLIDSGIAINQAGFKQSAFSTAINLSRPDLIKLFLEKGFKPELEDYKNACYHSATKVQELFFENEEGKINPDFVEASIRTSFSSTLPAVVNEKLLDRVDYSSIQESNLFSTLASPTKAHLAVHLLENYGSFLSKSQINATTPSLIRADSKKLTLTIRKYTDLSDRELLKEALVSASPNSALALLDTGMPIGSPKEFARDFFWQQKFYPYSPESFEDIIKSAASKTNLNYTDPKSGSFFHNLANLGPEGYTEAIYKKMIKVCQANIDLELIKSQNADGDTPIHIAARNADHIFVKMLAPESPNTQNNKGDTALHIALNSTGNQSKEEKVKSGHLAKNLVELGADIFIENNNKQTPIQLAIQEKRKDLIKDIIYQGVDPSNVNGVDLMPIAKKHKMGSYITKTRTEYLNETEASNTLLTRQGILDRLKSPESTSKEYKAGGQFESIATKAVLDSIEDASWNLAANLIDAGANIKIEDIKTNPLGSGFILAHWRTISERINIIDKGKEI